MESFNASGPHMVQRRLNKTIQIPTRIEPKVFLANERTFLHWLHYAIVLAVVAIAMLNFGNRTARALSAAFVVVAAAIMVRSLLVFRWRSERIRQRDQTEYADNSGPFYLVTALGALTVANVWLQWDPEEAEGGDL
jgi:uncharacterized membrane protein YidH (DUF202 family)